MNRKEYMEELTRKLAFLPEGTRTAALSFYEEMMDDRMEDGMDEMSAVAAMESPAAIADRLRAEPPTDAPTEENTAAEQPASGKKWQEEPMGDEAFRFSTLADKVLKSVHQAMENTPDVEPEIKKEVGDAMQQAQMAMQDAQGTITEAVQSIRDQMKQFSMDEDDGEVPPETVGEYQRKIFTCPAEALRAVRLTAIDKPIRIRPCAGKDATLIYYTSERDPYEAGIDNGVLTLSNRENGKGRGGFSIFSFGLNIRINWSKASPKIYLLLPPDALVDLTAKTSNGSIRMEGLKALCAVDLVTSNSRIDLKRVQCKSMEMKTSNARLSLEEVESKQYFRGSTSNGRIEGNGLVSSQDMTLKTSNSRIRLEGARARAGMTLTTSNGNITVSRLSAEKLELRTSNSSIQGTLPGRQTDWAIQSGTSNGHNSLPRTQPGSKPLSVHTSNGSINLTFEG